MVKKKVTKRKTPSKKKPTTENILVQNSVNMQKVMIKLIERFERLSDKIDELLELFEDSAKILVKKEIESGRTENMSDEFLEKINKLIDQNKVIAKGLTLIHEHKSDNFQKESFAPSPYIEDKDFIPKRSEIPPFKKPISKQIPQKKKPVFEIPE